MSKDMLGVAMRKLVTLPNQVLGIVCDLLEKLSDPEWVEATKRFLRKENPWSEPATLLRRVAMTTVGGANHFCAKDYLEANVGWMSDSFRQLFLNKIEENVGPATIAVDRLERQSVDASIMVELGEHAKIQLTHFFKLLQGQSKGEKGVLLVNGWANIVYILGTDGNFWAVGARWGAGSGCWSVHARSVGDPRGWDAGRQVLSRDS